MLFNKNPFRNRRYNEKNPSFYETRLVYAFKFMPEGKEIKSLSTEYVRGQDILENRIRALDEEIKISEQRSRAKRKARFSFFSPFSRHSEPGPQFAVPGSE